MVIATGDIIRATARCLVDLSSDYENTFYYECIDDNALDQSNLIYDILVVIDTLYKTIDQDMANNMTFADVTLQNVTKNEVYGAQSWISLLAGGNVNSMMPPGVAVFCWAPLPFPRSRGRKWLGIFCEGHINEGIWDTPIIAACTAFLALLETTQTGTGGSTWRNVVPHRLNPGVTPATFSYEYTPTWVLTNNPGYQRRRRKTYGS